MTTQLKELGQSITQLRTKTHSLNVKISEINNTVNDLVMFAEITRLITYVSIILVMVVLLVRHWGWL